MRAIAAALLLVTAVSAGAVTILPGDVAVTSMPICCILPPPPTISLYSDALALKTTLTGQQLVAFGPNGHLFTAAFSITEFDTTLAVVRTITPPASLAGLAVAQNGDLYAMGGNYTVYVLSATGTLKTSFPLPFSLGALVPLSFDLAPDQCTIFYTDSAGNGRRFNACTSQPLPNLPGGTVNAVRAFGDGGYLVARTAPFSMTDVEVYDAGDHLLRTYPLQLDTTTALAFDANPAYFWADTLGGMARIRFSDGAKVATGGSQGYSMAVNGEQRPVSAAATLQDVPALSTTLLAALAIALIALAMHRLGR